MVTLEIEETHAVDTITLEKGRRCVEEPSHKEVVFDETRRTCGKQLRNARLACCDALSATYTETREALAFAVVTKKSRYRLASRPVKDFPKLPEVPATWQPVPAKPIAELVEGVFFSISTDTTRTHLNGMLLESCDDGRLRAVSTDGHRASLVERDVALRVPTGASVPREFCAELKKLATVKGVSTLEVGFLVSPAGSVFARVAGSARVYSARLHDARFPPYEQVIPKTCGRSATVNREVLAKVLKRLLLVAPEKTHNVALEWRTTSLVATADDGDNKAEETLEHSDGRNLSVVQRDGEAFKIGVNVKYLLESLGQLDSETVWIGMSDEVGKWGNPSVPCYGEQDPFLVRATCSSVDTYCVMPTRL